ncbi:DltE [Pseudonocardia sp. EC080610-09]|uniref:SDR family oxidoreductase n=1 Tax=unclassified Pseudonocardia TaxID=2619320 RepID=UPI0006CB1962|nr:MULTISPECIES: SDR family NAD(P)-dependent oxidoreductase [unclassified Pseudonocardia]ALE72818.1 DltE [Pseudonocardia sp. EC080625-04]ALL76140.1 DltE [Pseudonocardia sp. EC080610-09]ALL83164.1 DltE [Pseudonocardia sp. EC080619-01]
MQITGRTVFIPGSTSGIGLALALALRERGNTVILGGRRRALLDELTAAHPGLDAVEIDTADPASIRTAVAEVLDRHPDLDVLVAMAGIMRVEDWHTPDGFVASAEEVVTTNVLGPVRLIGELVEHFRTRPAATIVTVSSGLAFVPLGATPSYNASKAAVHMLTESLRLQLADTTVGLHEIVPPSVATDLLPTQRESPIAMPLDEFVAEVVQILDTRPDDGEVLVERVGFLRHAEARGDYDDVVRRLNASDPHRGHVA